MNSEITSIGFALDPSSSPAFLLDWELTRKCNMDCSYCGTDLNGGHDNLTDHPPVDQCLKTIDFLYEYVDLYMQQKKLTQRRVVLNVYGGESLFHPNIIEILEACRTKYKPYESNWHLTITTTTNAVVNKSIWQKVISLVDEFTVSYHAEHLPKQEKLFFENLLELKNLNKPCKCIVVMHDDPQLWKKSKSTIKFCEEHQIRYIPKAIDGNNRNYDKDQFSEMKIFWASKTTKHNQVLLDKIDDTNNKPITPLEQGRACCGGRKLSVNCDLKSAMAFVPKQGFEGWYCSVNWFFLFVRQFNGDVFTNKDCRTSFNGKVEPIGNLSDTASIISTLANQFNTKSMPVIQCIKPTCNCGFCAPKADNLDDYKSLIKRNVVTDVIKFEP